MVVASDTTPAPPVRDDTRARHKERFGALLDRMTPEQLAVLLQLMETLIEKR